MRCVTPNLEQVARDQNNKPTIAEILYYKGVAIPLQ